MLGNTGLTSPRSSIQPGDVDLAEWKAPQWRAQERERRDVGEHQLGLGRSQHSLRPDQMATDLIELCPVLSQDVGSVAYSMDHPRPNRASKVSVIEAHGQGLASQEDAVGVADVAEEIVHGAERPAIWTPPLQRFGCLWMAVDPAGACAQNGYLPTAIHDVFGQSIAVQRPESPASRGILPVRGPLSPGQRRWVGSLPGVRRTA